MTAPSRTATILFWALLIAGLAPALYYNFARSMNYDIAWLAIAAERLLRGGTMFLDAFETNPPLSLLIMTPPVLLSWITTLPIYFITTLYSTIIVLLSAAACRALLRRLEFFSAWDINVFTAAYLAAMIVFPTVDYGERDHLVLAGVLPFVLWQICFTLHRPVPHKLTWAVLAAGVLLILVKPHHGLLPTILLLHRAIVQKRLFGIMRDPDFKALAAGVMAYLVVIGIFFPDYALAILPDVLAMYLPHRESGLIDLTLFYAGMIAVFGFPYMFVPAEKRQRAFTLFLFAAALIALVPYFVQGKNYWYHLVPALVLYYCALAMMAQTALIPLIARMPQALRTTQPFILIIALIAGAYAFMPVNNKFPSHTELRALPLTQRIAQCPQPCTFFLFNKNIGIIHPTAIYSGREHASRFPGLWFLPALIAQDQIIPATPDAAVGVSKRQTYTTMLAADFAKYKPKLVFIGRFALDEQPDRLFNFGAYFSVHDEFMREWLLYSKTGEITVTNTDYYRGTNLEDDTPVIFDIYERNPDADK